MDDEPELSASSGRVLEEFLAADESPPFRRRGFALLIDNSSLETMPSCADHFNKAVDFEFTGEELDDEPELSASNGRALGEILGALESPVSAEERWDLQIELSTLGDCLLLLSSGAAHFYEGDGSTFTGEEWACVVSAVKRSSSLKALIIVAGRSVDARVVEELLSGPSPLRVLQLNAMWGIDSEDEASMLAERIHKINTLEEVEVVGNDGDYELLYHVFPPASKSGDRNIPKVLKIIGFKVDLRLLPDLLRRDSKLMTLELLGTFFDAETCKLVFEALKENSHLKKIVMGSWGLRKSEESKVLAYIMDLLRVNFFLEEIKLLGSSLSKNESYVKVRALLQRNAALHRDALNGLAMMKPKVARVFLCGFPFAGKTQLRKTITEERGLIMRTRRYWESIAKHSSLQRTAGIEVQVLEKEGVKISLWDLGGQDEYHAFHDLVIPNGNGYESACSFVIVCSRVVRGDAGRLKYPKLKDQKAIEREVDYWLRFILSKSTRLEKYSPHVTLVFSHSDCVSKDAENDNKASLEEIMGKLKLRFGGSLEIWSEPFIIDGRSERSVKPLATFLEASVREILQKSCDVFAVCEETKSALGKWNMDNPKKPVMKWDEFETLCKPSVPSSGVEDEERFQRICLAIALALHDSGDVIYFEKLKYVVANPHWFCHEIMGRILSLDEMSRSRFGKDPVANEEGFVERKVLKSILRDSYVERGIVSKNSKSGVDGELVADLIQIMVEMNLCFEDLRKDDEGCNRGLFVPATLRMPSNSGSRKLQWNQVSDVATVYLGRRLECDDSERTFLTQGFFPRLQVSFKKRFPSDVNCKLHHNSIYVRFDGKEVYVEYCEESHSSFTSKHMDGYIDILVKSTKSMVETLGFTNDQVLKLMREVCYSPTFGCLGVNLVESIMSPKCVEELWSRERRKDQVVRVERLMQDVMSLHNSTFIPNSGYVHEWPMPGGNDKAQDLLGSIIWQELLNERLMELKEYEVQFEDVEEAHDYKDALSTSFDVDVPDVRATLDPQQSIIYDEIRATKREVIGHMDKRLDELELNMAAKFEDIVALQKSLLCGFSRKLEKVACYLVQLQQRQIPRLMYVTTQDVGMLDWLKTSLLPQVVTVKLHFLCEHKSEIHVVDGQDGYVQKLAGEGVLRARPYVIYGLQVLCILAKLGGLGFASVGPMIGDLERVIVKGIADALPIAPLSSSFSEGCVERKELPYDLNIPISMEEQKVGEQWLVDILRGKSIERLFGLCRIQYSNGSNEVVWVCKRHKDEGCASRTMELLPV